MAGLTNSGFEPETLGNIQTRIKGRLEAASPGFDFSPESPDGQQLDIFSYEIFILWQELAQTYHSNNPLMADGGALRNVGMLTGIPYGAAERSYSTVELQGTDGTLVAKGSQVSDSSGNIFFVAFDTTIPSNAQVVAETPGPIPVEIGTIVNVVTSIAGWTGVTQTQIGVLGTKAQTAPQYRNLRQRTVMRNFSSVVDTLGARLLELGIEQALIVNNDSSSVTEPDGTPPNTVHVTVGEITNVTDFEIAKVILDAKGWACPTYLHPTTGITVAVPDSQGVSHDINFSKAIAVPIEVEVDVTYLDSDNAGAETDIVNALAAHINSLLSGDDVIISRLYPFITPYGKAQVNTLLIGTVAAGSPAGTNVVLTAGQYATCDPSDILLTETP